MEFRPCIDIHNGKVKQIIGGSLSDQADWAKENYVSGQDAAFFARLYQSYGIKGGHIILLNPPGSEYYEMTKAQALNALSVYPQGLQIGGSIRPENAEEFLRAGASHVIVTSYVFQDGHIHYDRLQKMVEAVGKEHLVLDLSCGRIGEHYIVMTDRWQKISREVVNSALLDKLSENCDEFLVHAVDVEGKKSGIETDLVSLLGQWAKGPVTYAGGVHSFEDLKQLKTLGKNHVNVTIGSALDLFGGNMAFEEVLHYISVH